MQITKLSEGQQQAIGAVLINKRLIKANKAPLITGKVRIISLKETRRLIKSSGLPISYYI